MPRVILPNTLTELFPGALRTVEVEASTVTEALDQLDSRWPGMRSRLCESATRLRRHIVVFVDSDRSDLTTPVGPGAEVRIVPALSGGGCACRGGPLPRPVAS